MGLSKVQAYMYYVQDNAESSVRRVISRLNEGCLKPLGILIPKACLFNPGYPATVVAGNVETSQLIIESPGGGGFEA